MTLYTQLNFGGNCEEAFRYYEKHVGGTITMMMYQKQLPPGSRLPSDSDQFVIHARMAIAGGELIGNDVPVEVFQPMRSAYLYLSVDSTGEAERIFAALADGGKITMKMEETFFAFRFGQVRDRFGTLWSIIHPRPA